MCDPLMCPALHPHARRQPQAPQRLLLSPVPAILAVVLGLGAAFCAMPASTQSVVLHSSLQGAAALSQAQTHGSAPRSLGRSRREAGSAGDGVPVQQNQVLLPLTNTVQRPAERPTFGAFTTPPAVMSCLLMASAAAATVLALLRRGVPHTLSLGAPAMCMAASSASEPEPSAAEKYGWDLSPAPKPNDGRLVIDLPVKAIIRPLKGTRSNDQEKVQALMDSIQEIGLQEPIDVLDVEGQYYGFSGCHRYEAHERLGLETIRCRVRKATPKTLRMHLM